MREDPALAHTHSKLIMFMCHDSMHRQVNGALEVMRADPNMKHLAKMGIDELLHHLDEVPEEHANTIRNAGGEDG